MKSFNHRRYSTLDLALLNLDAMIRNLSGHSHTSQRISPAAHLPESILNTAEIRQVAGLMRVNHAGEVCAQALYQGQAFTAQLKEVRDQMQQAAVEENDHLQWCRTRLLELNSHTSYLNPAWYCFSFMIGAIAGLAGDEWSLGFVAETEKQVVIHLKHHLEKLPTQDERTRGILMQMQKDEAHHQQIALEAGAAELPIVIKKIMRVASKCMVMVSYWI